MAKRMLEPRRDATRVLCPAIDLRKNAVVLVEAGDVIPADGEVIEVGAIPGVVPVDPTGVGDSFRAGFLAGLAAGLNYERSAQVGCTIASLVVETTGTQEYELIPQAFLERLGSAYGADAASEVDAALRLSR